MSRLATLFFIGITLASTVTAQNKKRVAVFNFDYATVHSGVASIFGLDVDVGKGIADLLVDELVKSGVYSVIERKSLDKILAEQNFSNSDRADPASAAKIGRLLGVDAIIIGSITQFGRDDKSTDVGGGAVSRLGGRFGIGGVSKKEAKATVGIAARVVNTETGEILASATGKGESTRSGTSLLGSGGGSGSAAGGGYDMTSKNFAATILGEAVNQAVRSVAKELDQDAARLPSRKIQVEGLIADVSQGTVILNVGGKAGVKAGDHLQVRRSTREVKDPATGKVLRRIEDKIGEIVITEVDEGSAVGTYTGATPAKVGDRVVSQP
ncbi:MAG: curli production assembly protein CsgG [Acidobacteria bacterium]|nr:curli production assembly protein CsgG [Acidobacteriota bacterium]